MTIEFRDVHASYDANTPILKGVSFTVENGEFVAFVGTNGAGKSTTMRLVNGLLKPESGQVLIDGVPTTQLKTSELARRVGFLFQNPDSQICSPTVREELLFGFKALGMMGEDAERRVDGIIETFGFNPDDDPFLLNRGTRQLLALASIVVLETPVVVLDEPTTGLDFRECVKVMDIIAELHRNGTTVIMVCHDMEVVADFAERVIVMSDGQVVDEGPTFTVLRNRATLERASLVPPQIVDISLALPLMQASLAGTGVARANTLNDMQRAVLAQVGSPRVAGMLGARLGDEFADDEGPVAAPGAQELAFSDGGASRGARASSGKDADDVHASSSQEDDGGNGMAPGSSPLANLDDLDRAADLIGEPDLPPATAEPEALRYLDVTAQMLKSSAGSKARVRMRIDKRESEGETR